MGGGDGRAMAAGLCYTAIMRTGIPTVLVLPV